MAEKIKEMALNGEFENSNNDYKMPFDDNVIFDIPALDILKKMIPISRSAMPELFPRKIFSGGLLGYVGYDVIAPYVGYKPQKISDVFPDVIMGFFTNVLAYSHSTHTIYQITNSINNYSPDQVISYLFDKFKQKDKEREKKPIQFDRTELMKMDSGFKSNTTEKEWESMIGKTKEHIIAGDIIQAVISRKMINESDCKPLDVYQALRILNPSPYMFYINFDGAHKGDIRLIGSSPEALISKNQEVLNTVPIAGTRRRGKNPEDEAKMESELLHDEKELAEHIMLVDLARNDLSKVSVPGSIDTYEFIKLRKFPNIMHLISKIRSVSYLDPFTILKSIFPAGTVSGAPKKRAMEIIHELEIEDRGPYAGTAGYISFTGDMDMAISIRTIFNKDKKYIAKAGAGIVADSRADREFLETENKMKGVISTINLANIIGGK
jgi:anthranilate synthase component 1